MSCPGRRLGIVSAAVAAILLSGCEHDAINVDSDVRDQIARCSGGIEVSLSGDLEASVIQDIATRGRLSASVSQRLQGVIFERLSPADRLPVYNAYLACLRGQAEIDSIVADVEGKWSKLGPLLITKQVSPPVVQKLLDLHQVELSGLRNYRLVEARQARKQIIIELAKLDSEVAEAYGERRPLVQQADGVEEPQTWSDELLQNAYGNDWLVPQD